MKRKLIFTLIIILLSLSGCQKSNISTIDKSSPENNESVVKSISSLPSAEFRRFPPLPKQRNCLQM